MPEGTQSGTTFRLRGKGIQYVNGRGRGDMYVKCEVEIPKKLNKVQREALKKFEGTLKEDNYETQRLLQAAERHVCIKMRIERRLSRKRKSPFCV